MRSVLQAAHRRLLVARLGQLQVLDNLNRDERRAQIAAKRTTKGAAMSVIMALVVNGDPKKLEEHVRSDPDGMGTILESAKSHGVIAHRFYGSEDGEIMVVDEWPDEQSFQSFFDENSGKLGPMFQAAGVTSEPQPKFWRKLETHDEYGWGA